MKRITAFAAALLCMLWIPGCTDMVNIASGGGEVLKQPPKLVLVCGSDTAEALLGTYTWEYDKGNGTFAGICADSAHPLACQEFLDTFSVSENMITLQFAAEPAQFTVRCWSALYWDAPAAEEETVQTNGYAVALKPGGYIYEVTAEFDYEQFGGTAYYSFYAVCGGHTHSLAGSPQTVENPRSGYCGNTVTTVCLNGREYTFEGSDSVALTDILINLAYIPEKVCTCEVSFTVDTEFGNGYGVELSKGFVRCSNGQADLTEEQVNTIKGIISRFA